MTKAEFNQLIGKIVGDWQLVDLLGTGKSAAVFRGVKGSEIAAVKIFDASLVEEFGKDAQLNRISRELTLQGHNHPNLVRILDGGECKATGHLYVVMELIDAPNLASVIKQVPRDRIRPIITQVAAAARYLLEDRGIVHRDIKPDNIAVDTEFSKATLLDLGVMRPLDVSKLAESTDGERQSFLGTLRYSPPEYVFRTERQDRDGYRAITFYQLGAVLYDLISRERLFSAFSLPKARLVKAVEQEIPNINQPDVPQELVLLADNCLLKNPGRRLSFVSWEDFEEPRMLESLSVARERVRRRFGSSLEYAIEESKSEKTDWAIAPALTEVQHCIATALKDICAGEKMFPRNATRKLMSLVEQSSTEVLLMFEPAPSLRLSESLSILVTATLIDIKPDIVEIDVRSTASYEDSAQGLQDLRMSKGSSVFRGVLNQAILSASLEDAIFRAIDFAQTAGADMSEIDLDS